jgi:Sec7-like guanine-nucleotide exchange factor
MRQQQVLDSFTSTFDFSGLSFDVGLRTFLESFKLPGEAQKIDRIINTFGKAYFKNAPDIFANEDAAYILAYSVIMLNTDRHNSQVGVLVEQFRVGVL